jgi:hypothetical protein
LNAITSSTIYALFVNDFWLNVNKSLMPALGCALMEV